MSLRCRAMDTIQAKSYVATIQTERDKEFLANNSKWHYSEILDKPFQYVPESFDSPAEVHLGTIKIPWSVKNLSLRIQTWGRNRSAPSSVFSVLMVDEQNFDGVTYSNVLKGQVAND